MSTSAAVLLGVVILAAVGGGVAYMWVQRQPQQRPDSGQLIGQGIGNLVGGIIGLATQ